MSRLVAGALAAAAALCGAVVSRADTAADCDLRQHRVNVYNTTVAADVVARLNQRRAELGREPVTVDGELWLKAMWRAGRTAASGRSLVVGPDPCPGDAEPLETGGRSFSRAVSPDDVLAHPYIVESGKLGALLAPTTRSVGIGIAFAYFHTSFVLYASDRAPSPLRNEPPAVSNESVVVVPATRRDLAPTLLANDRDDHGLVSVVAAEAAHGTVSLGWAGVRGHSVFYAPEPGFSGNDTLTYAVADAFGTTTTGTATLIVNRTRAHASPKTDEYDRPYPRKQ